MTSTGTSQTATELVAVAEAIEGLRTNRDARVRVGSTITAMRRGSGLTARELAHLVDVSRPWIYEIESGRTNASPFVYRRIADYFGVSLASLVGADQGS